MRTLGVDLSADPSRTGTCEVDWARGTVRFLERPMGDERLVEAVALAGFPDLGTRYQL